MRLILLVVLLVFALPSSARAVISTTQPDLVSFGGGYFDFDKTEEHRRSADFRLEYRWGTSLLTDISSSFKGLDSYIQFHPFVAAEATTNEELYTLGGFAMDGYIGCHGIMTWSEGVGLYEPGRAFRLGSTVEFRSQLEAGWRFDNQTRVTAQFSHISNDKITWRNPGAEIVGMYLHVPVNLFSGTQGNAAPK